MVQLDAANAVTILSVTLVYHAKMVQDIEFILHDVLMLEDCCGPSMTLWCLSLNPVMDVMIPKNELNSDKCTITSVFGFMVGNITSYYRVQTRSPKRRSTTQIQSVYM